MIIKTLKKIVVPAGTRLVLSQEQHAARQHSLFSTWPGSALVTKDIEFKAGETFAVEGELSRSIPVGDYETIDITEPVAEKPHKSKPSKAE